LYYEHFGLKQPPFKITPNTEFFFSGGNRGAVLDALVYAITSGEGIVKVVGEVGSGKTMLCRMLEDKLPENVERVYLANPSVAPEDILHAIAFELQLKLPAKADRLQVMQALQNYLIERHAQSRQVVIFVEEAQGMPLATLEEIRLLSNLETKNDKLLQIVLFGQPELEINLNEQHIRQLKERITHSFDLGPLAEHDIADYLISRLRTAGYYGPPLFTAATVKRMAKASKGLVRRINILADKAMLAAFAENAYAITPKHLKIAINDSEFGAEDTPANASKKTYWLAFATLLVGLAIGFGSPLIVRNPQHMPANSAPVAASVKPISKPLNAPVQSPASSAIATTATENTVAVPTQNPSAIAATPTPPSPPATSAMPASTAATEKSSAPSEAAIPAAQPSSFTSPPTIVDARLEATKSWLAQQSPSTVSIQIMVGENTEQMRRQLKSLTSLVEIDNLYMYRTNVGGKPYISVLYGSYADHVSAAKALADLPKPLHTYHPQLRTVKGITEEIKQLQ
jgi:type II secretory pathway predicted ATPase ExeA